MVDCLSLEPLLSAFGRGTGLRQRLPMNAVPSAAADGRTLALAVQGDASAFERLILLHQGAVYRLCLRFLRVPEEARDAAQEAFVRAFEAVHTFDPTLPFGPWVLRIARNHCLDLLRRRARANALEVADPVAGLGQDSFEAVAAGELRAALSEAVARLPEAQREALVLFHLERQSYREIAEILEVPIGTVMTWLHRGRQRLREQLVPQEEP